MRKIIFVLTALVVLAIVLIQASVLTAQDSDKKEAIKKVFDFVKSCGNYFLATTEGDQPRVRPFGSWALFEGKIYIQTGRVKNVSKQIAANPKIEICAYDGKGTWIRIQAVAVEDDRIEAKQFVLDGMPELKTMYSADDGNTQVFYLKDVTASLNSFSGDNWTETF
jgi:uncharacterized pyridoxamine 5'-phosphate oxidase family protein